VILSVLHLLVRRVPGCLMVLARREVPEDAELLVLRHDRAVRELTSFRRRSCVRRTGQRLAAGLRPRLGEQSRFRLGEDAAAGQALELGADVLGVLGHDGQVQGLAQVAGPVLAENVIRAG